jgi:integrase
MILEAAVEDGLLPRNPARSKRLRNPSRKVATRNALTTAELADIITHLHMLTEERDRMMLVLLIYTGMRRNEVLGLRWGDIDWGGGTIHVLRGVTYKGNLPQISTPKTAAGIRQIPIPAALRQWLIPGDKDCYVVGGTASPISEKTFIRMWQRIERTIDLHGATPHIFRHTYMTFAQRAQIPVKTLQTIGGYADLATLQDRYVHTQNEDIEAARSVIDGMFHPLL